MLNERRGKQTNLTRKSNVKIARASGRHLLVCAKRQWAEYHDLEI